jgi:hypothetical protein
MEAYIKEDQAFYQKVSEQQVILTTKLYEMHLVQTTFTCEATKRTWLCILERQVRKANDEIHRLWVEWLDRQPWLMVGQQDDDQTDPDD